MTVDFLNSKLFIGLITGLGGILVTHLFYKSKLRKEQKVRFENVIGENIAISLTACRDLAKTVMKQEVYDIENKLMNNEFDAFQKPTIYPAFMADSSTIWSFYEEIHSCRENHEKNLDTVSMLYLLYIDRYVTNLYLASKGEENDEMLHLLGIIIYGDLQNWSRDFQKHLTKKINHNPCKLYNHFGRKYDFLRKMYFQIPWEESIFCSALNEGNQPVKKPNAFRTFFKALLEKSEK